MPGSDSGARWRGAWTALLTTALAVGAHSVADGPPSGPGVALVVVVAGTLGAVSASTRQWRGAPALIAVLTAGQFLGHLVLAASGHAHTAGGAPTPVMVGAHAGAVVCGAVLIAVGDRLYRALSNTVRTLTASPSLSAEPCVIEGPTSDQPLQSMLRLAASLSRRGPPVGVLS